MGCHAWVGIAHVVVVHIGVIFSDGQGERRFGAVDNIRLNAVPLPLTACWPLCIGVLDTGTSGYSQTLAYNHRVVVCYTMGSALFGVAFYHWRVDHNDNWKTILLHQIVSHCF